MCKSRSLAVAVFVSAVLALIAWCGFASASEYGVSSYRPGFMDLFAGALPAPGSTVAKTYFLYQDADGLANTKINFTFKYDFEFAAQNRATGNELWLTAAIAL